MIKSERFYCLFARRLIGTIFFCFFPLYFLAFFLRNQLGLFCQLKHLRGNHKLGITYIHNICISISLYRTHFARCLFILTCCSQVWPWHNWVQLGIRDASLKVLDTQPIDRPSMPYNISIQKIKEVEGFPHYCFSGFSVI